MALSEHGLVHKHGNPVYRHFWVFFGTIVFADAVQWRMWFVALCRLQEGSIWVSKCWRSCSMCSCVVGCMPACWAPFCSHEHVSCHYQTACHIPAPKGKHVQLFKTRRRLARGSIQCLSIRMQATEWYLSCAREENCRILRGRVGQLSATCVAWYVERNMGFCTFAR